MINYLTANGMSTNYSRIQMSNQGMGLQRFKTRKSMLRCISGIGTARPRLQVSCQSSPARSLRAHSRTELPNLSSWSSW